MLTNDEEKELERQVEDASPILLLLLLFGRKNVRTNHQIEFNRRKGVFLLDGKVISLTTIRVLIAQIEKIGANRMQKHLDDLLAKRISVDEWRKRSALTLMVSHRMAAALALGGIDQIATSEELKKKTTEELNYLSGFASDIKAGKMSSAKMSARARSYMLSVATTYWFIDQMEKKRLAEVKRVKKLTGGFVMEPTYTEARRYRRARESCPGCVDVSGYWMPIAEMPPIGTLQCGGRCRCFIIYR